MADAARYKCVDPAKIDELQLAERPQLRIRWWIVLPLALVMAGAQAFLNLRFEFAASSTYLIATQISIIAFFFLVVLTLVLNPLLRVTRLMEPFNRAELMALFAAVFVSAGISSFGLMDQLLPLIATPFNGRLNTPQRGWDKNIIPHLNPHLYITDPARIEEFRQGFSSREGLWGRIPWMLWLKPLALWMIFVFSIYLMFYSLAMMLYRSWAHRERFIFPLARLPEDLMHDEDRPAGTLSSTLKSHLFWIAFTGVVAVLSYNAACQAEWFRGMTPLALGIDQKVLQDMLANSIFKGLADTPSTYILVFLISFTAIGIAFLLPLEISASIWVYHLAAMSLFLIAIWTAAGSSVKSFVSDWLWENHFVSGLGAGGLLAFSTAALVKLVMDHWSTVAADGRQGSGPVKVWRLLASFGWGGVLFAASLAIALCWLAWSNVPLIWGALFLAVVILITVGLMRIVTEGGIYWFQLHVGPFHLARIGEQLNLTVRQTFGLGSGSLIPGAVIAPLMPIYSILFLDIKTFMAPAVINSFKMQEEARAGQRTFHLIVAAAIVVTVIVSAVTMLYFVYDIGANRSSSWFFGSATRSLLDQTSRLATNSVGLSGQYNWLFYLAGAAWVVFSIMMRRKFFWWLHPIGFVMLANPLTCQLWTAFFIGWLAKKITVKYGGRHMFAKVRPFFIGLIFGELVSCFLWAVLAAWLDLDKVALDINRYLP